jgi:dihydropteroate synthase
LDHNPRVIEMAELRLAVRRMADVDEPHALLADRLFARTRRAIRLEGVAPDVAALLRRQAEALGIAVLDGMPASTGSAARILVADDENLRRLASVLETGGEKPLANAVRATLSSYLRTEFSLSWPDGERLPLGSETRVMGILNVTPDSFSDGGKFDDPRRALEAAAMMADEGAEILDVGGESSRPGALPVPEEEEIRRVVPLVHAIKHELSVRVSVDTYKASVARAALDAGADMVNDITAFSDPGMVPLLRDRRATAVVMHMRGTPATMQKDTQYVDLMASVVGYLRRAVEKAAQAGVADDKILVDPGLGFGKSAAGNLQILRELPTLRSVGRPVLIGGSRKSFIGAALNLPVGERLEGSLAVAALAAWQGAHMIRTHDVGETIRVVRMIDAIRNL